MVILLRGVHRLKADLQGKTRQEVLKNIREAIGLYLEPD